MRNLLPALLLAVLATACLPLRPPPDPEAAAGHYRQAQTLLKIPDYPAALRQLEQAQALAPGNATYALAHGDIAENLGDYALARGAYDEALKDLPREDLQRREIAWRLGVLEILRFDDAKRAAELAKALIAYKFRSLDLEGLQFYRKGQYRLALNRFEQARSRAKEPGHAAFAAYHASLAYHRLGEKQQTFTSLLEAINQARSHGLAKDIERFFHELNQSPATRQQ